MKFQFRTLDERFVGFISIICIIFALTGIWPGHRVVWMWLQNAGNNLQTAFSHPNASGWIQAIGSLLGIGAAFLISHLQLKKIQAHEQKKQIDADLSVLSAASGHVETAHRLLQNVWNHRSEWKEEQYARDGYTWRLENSIGIFDLLIAKKLPGIALKYVVDARGAMAVATASIKSPGYNAVHVRSIEYAMKDLERISKLLIFYKIHTESGNAEVFNELHR